MKANARPDRVKARTHRRCPSCLKTHISKGASKPATRLNGEFPAMLRVYVEIDVKQRLIELAQTERLTLSALVRKIVREWMATNQP